MIRPNLEVTMTAEQDLVAKLDAKLRKDRRDLLKLDHYHEGLQPLKYMAPALEAMFGDRVAQVVINWPRMITEAYENRQDIVGFRWTDSNGKSWDQDLWDMHVANDGQQRTQLLNTDKLVFGRDYVIVGSGEFEGDAPVWTEESPLQVTALHNPKTREVTSALKRWSEDESEWANLYLPDATITFRNVGRGWTQKARDDHKLGVVPVVEFVTRGRILRQSGVSVFQDIVSLADAANKMATDMMLSGEFHAMPRRWALGLDESDFVDKDGNQIDAWSVLAGRIWSTPKTKDEVELGQFTEADLANFHNTIKLIAQLVAQIGFLPDDYMSFTTDSPPSADSVKAKESRFIKRIERENASSGAAMGKVKQLELKIMGIEDPKMRSIETLWRDPATPTMAQVADATVKLVTANVIPVEFARELLGYTLEDRQRMKEMDAAAKAADPLAVLADQFRTQPVAVNAGA